jgi:AcrR family transcriptional regulator
MTVDNQTRKNMILDAAARLIIQFGYDKTTMSDIADAVGLNRPLVYAHFKSKDEVLEALIAREMRQYGMLWFEHLMADPNGGTVASIYRSIAHALKHTPFIASVVTRDEGTWGRYLRKPGNIFSGMQSASMTRELMQAMQDAGAIRKSINIPAMAYIVDVLANGMVSQGSGIHQQDAPAYEELLETVAEMFDRMLTPEDGGNLEAGKQVLRQMAEAARAHFEQMETPKERQQQ